MVQILASVRNRDEALGALAAGADFIDLKEPDQGALGAVSVAILRDCVAAIAGAKPVSATIGDVPFRAEYVVPRVEEWHAAGADYAKIGVFEDVGSTECLRALSGIAGKGARLVAVFLADAMPCKLAVSDFAKAGFAGVMLDTADKAGGRLTGVLPMESLASFVREAHAHKLLCGLAGSLDRTAAIALAPLGPDYLGFRTALCKDGVRGGIFDPGLLSAIRTAIFEASRQTAA